MRSAVPSASHSLARGVPLPPPATLRDPSARASGRAKDLLRQMNSILDSVDSVEAVEEDGPSTSFSPKPVVANRRGGAVPFKHSDPAPGNWRSQLQFAGTTATRAALMGAMLQQLLSAADSQAAELARVAAGEAAHLESIGGLEGMSHTVAGLLSEVHGVVDISLASCAAALDQMTLLASLAVTELGLSGDAGAADGLSDALHGTLQAIQAAASAPPAALSASLVDPPEIVGGLITAVVHSLSDLVASVDLSDPALSPVARGLLRAVQALEGADPLMVGAAGAGIIALLAVSLPKNDGDVPNEVPLRYDSERIGEFMMRRPLLVLRRSLVVAAEALHILAMLIMDWQTGRWEANMPLRAVQAREAVERLGPTYIKLAQLMSTRVDMFPKPYIAEFSKLQDRVRPFSTEQAREILTAEIGRSPESVFAFLSERPVAAASIGQVYRGRLREQYGGGEVAVKVQRPNILENSALDLFVLRRILLALTALPALSARSDLIGLLDEWSSRFFLEMDYTHEADNSTKFAAQMATVEGVMVATVFHDFSTRRVLTTEWVRGEKLSESKAEDVKQLVTTMLNCYLIQLLETGFLHADPHPGNLIRTPDGKICLLDFGLMAEVSVEQRECLVDFIAHLSTKDWDGFARDMVKLGFIPEDAPDPHTAGLIPMLGSIMGQIVDGGGVGRISITQLMTQMEGIAEGYPLRVPPYFALIFRAFGVLEGIALKVDPEYSIVLECFPYLSRRLLTDSSEHSKALLRSMLYTQQGRLDVRRLQRFAQGFKQYNSTPAGDAASADGGAESDSSAADADFDTSFDNSGSSGRKGGSRAVAAAANGRPRTAGEFAAQASAGSVSKRRAPRRRAPPANIDPAVKDALRIVFSRQGSFMQEMLVEELVAAVDALSREAVSELVRLIIGSAGAAAALGEMEALGPVTPLVVSPLSLPLEALAHLVPQVELTEEDEEALDNVQAIWELLKPSLVAVPNPSTARAAAFILIELLQMAPELLPGVQSTSGRFIRQLLGRIASRLADELQRPQLPAGGQQPYSSLTPRSTTA